MEGYDEHTAESYDKGHGQGIYPGEKALFDKSIREAKGKILEVGCGTGRFILPYLKEGISIEGFDSSEPMLAILKEKAEKEGLKPTVYHQSMQELDLEDRYSLIFAPQFVIQYIEKWEEVLLVLENFKRHLEKGGKLIITLVFPQVAAHKGGQKQEFRKVQDTVKVEGGQAGSGKRMFVATEQDIQDQLIKNFFRVETWEKGQVTKEDQFHRCMRWFSPYEMRLLLEKAGFKEVTLSGEAPSEKGIFSMATYMNFTATL